MAEAEQPQIYLITPQEFDLAAFSGALTRVLDRVEIACLRLSMASPEEDRILRAADALREIAYPRDLPLVIDRHVQLAERLGLDGVHLTDGSRSVRAARKALGADAIVGAFCGISRHDGMTAGEAGADYVAFGPVSPTPLGDGSYAEDDLFAWWSEMIELPVVAEGALDVARVRDLGPVADFLGIGPEIWGTPDPAAALSALLAPLR